MRVPYYLVALLACCGGEPKAPVTPPAPPSAAAAPDASVPAPPPASASTAAPLASNVAPDVATDNKMKDEATKRLIMIARFAVGAWEREQFNADGKGTHHELCPSTKPTPATLDRGKRVAAKDDDWMKDPGWSCLQFLPGEEHWFQYEAVKVDDNTVKVFARRYDLELELDVTRKPKAEWKIATSPIERKR